MTNVPGKCQCRSNSIDRVDKIPISREVDNNEKFSYNFRLVDVENLTQLARARSLAAAESVSWVRSHSLHNFSNRRSGLL